MYNENPSVVVMSGKKGKWRGWRCWGHDVRVKCCFIWRKVFVFCFCRFVLTGRSNTKSSKVAFVWFENHILVQLECFSWFLDRVIWQWVAIFICTYIRLPSVFQARIQRNLPNYQSQPPPHFASIPRRLLTKSPHPIAPYSLFKAICQSAKNTDRSTIRSFAHIARSFACSALLALLACSTALTRLLTHSLPSSWDSEWLDGYFFLFFFSFAP